MTTSRSKAQGSRRERLLRRRFRAAGFLVEDIHHGPEGDIAIRTVDTERIIVEVKDAANLSPHAAILRAVAKARRAGHQGTVWLDWQRSIVKPGNTRRSPVGPAVVVMLEADAIRLAGGDPNAEVLADAEG